MRSERKLKNPVFIGDVFSRLTVSSGPHYFDKNGKKASHMHWTCICRCGNSTHVDHYNLVQGKSSSCGCFQSEQTRQALTTHGEASRATRTAEWGIWTGMKDRCLNENEPHYKNYGGRGIKVCDRWMSSYENFLVDMGRRPTSRHTLERNNVDGDYEPDNCRWATYKEQARNKRNNVILEFNGESRCLAEWTEKLGLKETLIRSRIGHGWSVERAFTEPTGARSVVSRMEKTYLLARKVHLEKEIKKIDDLLARVE